MMCRTVAITQLALVARSIVHSGDLQDGINKQTNTLVNHVPKMQPLHDADLDMMTLARTPSHPMPLSPVGRPASQIYKGPLSHHGFSSSDWFPKPTMGFPGAFTNKQARSVQAAVDVTVGTVSGFRSPKETAAASEAKVPIMKDPRSAVAITICRTQGAWDKGPWEYLFVQRSNPPRAGSWSVPSGKIHFGEDILKASAREIAEETGLTANQGLRLHPSPLGTSDFSFPIDSTLIGSTLGIQLPTWLLPRTRFEYSIEVTAMLGFATLPNAPIVAGDDAMNARWFTLEELETELEEVNERANTVAFLKKVEHMLAQGVLQPDVSMAVGIDDRTALQLSQEASPSRGSSAWLLWICLSMYIFMLTKSMIGMSRKMKV